MRDCATNPTNRILKTAVLLALSCILVLGMTVLCGCSSSKPSTNSGKTNTAQTANTTSRTNTSTQTKKVSSWEEAKSVAIDTWMKVHQTNLDNSELKYMDNGYGNYGYVVRCYIDHGSHIETLFLYAVSANGRVYDMQLAKYVS